MKNVIMDWKTYKDEEGFNYEKGYADGIKQMYNAAISVYSGKSAEDALEGETETWLASYTRRLEKLFKNEK